MQPEWIGRTNPLDEQEWTCPSCGESDAGDTFTDQSGEEFCGECAALDFNNTLLHGKYEVAYVGNNTFSICEKDKPHGDAVNNAILTEIVKVMSEKHSGNVDEASEIARDIIKAIASGKIDNLRIQY